VALAQQLKLGLPDLPWHTQRDRIAALAAGLGMLVGSLGKIARDISLLMQTEVAEAHEPIAVGRGGSSTMPQKRNPIASANILAAALRVPGLVSTVLVAMVQEHERGLGGWHAEWEVLPEIFRLCAGALSQSVEVIEGLGVDAQRMLANLGLTQGLPLAEAVTMALAPVLGRSTAHGLIETASRKASALGLPLEKVLNEMPEVRMQLAPEQIRELLDPVRYLGSSGVFIDAVLARARELFNEEAPCRPSN
jgi:3-carboxy-cis,cis-muconate cycloisomerase